MMCLSGSLFIKVGEISFLKKVLLQKVYKISIKHIKVKEVLLILF